MSQSADALVDLAQRILHHAQILSAAFHASNIPPPSFGQKHVPSWPVEATEARYSLLHDVEKLQRLAMDPLEMLMGKIQPEVTALHVVFEFKIAQAVPLDDDHGEGTASYAEIAQRTGLAEREVRRVLKMVMMEDIFRKTEDGKVAHTAASKLLASDQNLIDWADVSYKEIMPAKYKTADALKQSPASSKPNESGFAYSNNNRLDMFTYFKNNPDRARAFRSGMGAVHKRGGFELEHLIQRFPARRELNDRGGVCVDVGGSSGETMFALAHALHKVHCVVQDLPSTIENHAAVPDELQGRIEFMAHDFFTEQPIGRASVYLLRNVLHNWSDEDSARIIRRLAAVMNNESRIVINDWCIADEEEGHSAVMEKSKRIMDINMLSLRNSRERDVKEWRQLVKDADEQLLIESIDSPTGSNYSLIMVRKTQADGKSGS